MAEVPPKIREICQLLHRGVSCPDRQNSAIGGLSPIWRGVYLIGEFVV